MVNVMYQLNLLGQAIGVSTISLCFGMTYRSTFDGRILEIFLAGGTVVRCVRGFKKFGAGGYAPGAPRAKGEAGCLGGRVDFTWRQVRHVSIGG